MTSIGAETTLGGLRITVSRDRMQAWVECVDPATLSSSGDVVDVLLQALEAARIAIDDRVGTNIDQFAEKIQNARKNPPAGEPDPAFTHYLIAEGITPTDATDAVFEWDPTYAPKTLPTDEKEAIDYFTYKMIRSAEAGACVGRVRHATRGVAGRDVYGNAVEPKRAEGREFELGPLLRYGEDGCAVMTERPGRVVEHPGSLSLCETLEINGDVDFDSGSVNAALDVLIRGTIRTNFTVHTTGSIQVGQAVEAANVRAGGDIIVNGGIYGGDSSRPDMGQIHARGSVIARLCNEATIQAGGEVRIEREIRGSTIRTNSHVVVVQGVLLGGFTWARDSITADVIGSPGAVCTTVAVGIPASVARRLRHLRKRIDYWKESARAMNTRIAPLLANAERLTPQQREYGKRLTANARDMMQKAIDLQSEYDVLVERSRAREIPTIAVQKTLHAGACCILNGNEVLINQHIAGPVRVECLRVDGRTQCILISERNDTRTILQHAPVKLDSNDDKAGDATEDGDELLAFLANEHQH